MASLESRITAPDAPPPSGAPNAVNPTPNVSGGPQPTNWADDNGQMDGATDFSGGGGGGGIEEPEFDVEVKLIDQKSPLYSAKSFEELGM